MRVRNISLVRHAPSIHPPGTVPPRDPGADTGDRRALAALAGALPARARWWVSPMRRCRMTAEALLRAGAEAASLDHDDRLVELDLGEYHGMGVDAVAALAGGEFAWHLIPPRHRPPGGESFAMLHERSKPVVDDLEAGGGGHLVVVCHAMVIRSLLAHTLGLSIDQAHALGVDNLSLTELACLDGAAAGHAGAGGAGGWNGRWMLKSLNRVFA